LQVEFPGVRRVVGALAFVFLGACSGGGGNDSARNIHLSTSSLAFSATATDTSAPAPQVVTVTFSEGVTNITALHTGSAIDRVDVALNGTSAQLTVVPASPTAIGAGAFRGTIAVTAYFCGDANCSRLEAGATQAINTSYQVSPVVNEVAPKVAVAGTEGTAIIRGVGLQGFAVQGVRFGSTAATEKTDTSGTEIRAKFPALTAGSYPVTLDIPTHTGPITSTATLVVVDPVTHAAQALAWPGAVTAVYSLEYDALRGAVFAATDTGGGQIVRYAYASGAWQPATSVSIANLKDATLTTDAAQILAITTTAVTPIDAATLALGTPVAAPSMPENSFLKTIAMMNTNQALITTGIASSTSTPVYAYTVRGGTLVQLSTVLDNATARSSANGATVALIQGDPTLTTAPVFYSASASTGLISATAISLNQNAVPPAIDRDSTRLVLNGTNVYKGDSTLLGKLPDTTAGAVLRPDGKRVYTYDTAVNAVRVFDVSADTASDQALTPLGDPVPLAAAPGSAIRMTITPDANTLFIAGSTQLVVQPTPAL
jgi:hypothetical protein